MECSIVEDFEIVCTVGYFGIARLGGGRKNHVCALFKPGHRVFGCTGKSLGCSWRGLVVLEGVGGVLFVLGGF